MDTVITRAVIDIGSGSTKMDVCRVRLAPDASATVLDLLLSEESEVLLMHDCLANDNALSGAVVARLTLVLTRYVACAEALGATAATTVFRTATNGEATLARLPLHVRLISQAHEGALGFATATAAAATHAVEVPMGSLVSWDSGGASFQLALQPPDTDALRVFQGQLGSAVVTARMRSVQQALNGASEQRGVNPCTPAAVAALQAALIATDLPLAPPDWLAKALAAGATVVGIGGANCMFRVAHLLVGDGSRDITPETLTAIIARVTGYSDADFEAAGIPQPDMVVPKLVLMLAVMTWLQLPRMRYFETNGNCLGALMDPSLWQGRHH